MRLMIVGDLNGQLISASKMASESGAKVFHVPDLHSALHSLRSGKGADSIMMDIYLDIPLFLKSLESEKFSIPVIACGINVDKARAALAVQAGAREYLPLPPEREMIATILEMLSGVGEGDPIYKSAVFKETIDMARHIAPTYANVLITGETGTGKEVISRFIHNNSDRASKGFIAVNCAAIPDNLLESELFGHEKGAFTGAIARRCGKFEEANGGTILLDEISEMDLKLQSKLLRVIQEKEVVRVGGNAPIALNVRIIATSNRDLPEMIAAGDFREDLFYRLNVIHLELPSLRERPEDAQVLANHFILKYVEVNGLSPKSLSTEALNKILQHRWPGNVRELENVIHRAVILSRTDEIGEGDIKLLSTAPSKDDGFEKNAVLGVVEYTHHDYNKAASILGVSINSLKKRLEKFKEFS